MNSVKIPKKKPGEFRTIYLPSKEEKILLREHMRDLENVLNSFEANGRIPANVVHGFRCGKSPVTNASEHIGYNYTLSMDLADFFDSVRPHHVNDVIKKEVVEKVFVENAPRQGLPSSPSVCNLAATKMDLAICKYIKKNNLEIKYTRYADDLSFSFNDRELFSVLKERVVGIVSKCGFKINARKTRLQDSRFGRREITGVMVDAEGVFVSRSFRRKMRAAKHQDNKESLRGMEEWAKLKLPRLKPRIDPSQQETLKKLVAAKRGEPKGLKIRPLKEIKDGPLLITNDLAYIWGMSDLGDGWTSCYRKNGCNSNAPVFLSHFDISVGLYLSPDSSQYCGMKRQKIKARCIIYHTKDGKSYARSLYGNAPYSAELKAFLMKNGVEMKIAPFEVAGYGKSYTKSAMYGGLKKINVSLKQKKGKFVKLKS